MLSISWRRLVAKRMAFEDLADAVSTGGPGAMLSFPNRWRKYVDAVAVIGGSNLNIDRSTGRIDQPVLASKAAPGRAEYILQLPSVARYEIAVRCAVAEPPPAPVGARRTGGGSGLRPVHGQHDAGKETLHRRQAFGLQPPKAVPDGSGMRPSQRNGALITRRPRLRR